MAETPTKWKAVDTTFVKLEKGQSVEGMLIEKDSQPFHNNGVESYVGKYKIRSADGIVQTILGSTQLDDLLNQVQVQTIIRVTYMDDVKSSNKRLVKQYKLEIAE